MASTTLRRADAGWARGRGVEWLHRSHMPRAATCSPCVGSAFDGYVNIGAFNAFLPASSATAATHGSATSSVPHAVIESDGCAGRGASCASWRPWLPRSGVAASPCADPAMPLLFPQPPDRLRGRLKEGSGFGCRPCR